MREVEAGARGEKVPVQEGCPRGLGTSLGEPMHCLPWVVTAEHELS